jgi:hypothetical protein
MNTCLVAPQLMVLETPFGASTFLLLSKHNNTFAFGSLLWISFEIFVAVCYLCLVPSFLFWRGGKNKEWWIMIIHESSHLFTKVINYNILVTFGASSYVIKFVSFLAHWVPSDQHCRWLDWTNQGLAGGIVVSTSKERVNASSNLNKVSILKYNTALLASLNLTFECPEVGEIIEQGHVW